MYATHGTWIKIHVLIILAARPTSTRIHRPRYQVSRRFCTEKPLSFATQPFCIMFFTMLAQPFDDQEMRQRKVAPKPQPIVVVDAMPYHELPIPRLAGTFFKPPQPHHDWLQHQIVHPYRWGNMLNRHIFVSQTAPERVLQGQSWNSLRIKSHLAFRHGLFIHQNTTLKR